MLEPLLQKTSLPKLASSTRMSLSLFFVRRECSLLPESWGHDDTNTAVRKDAEHFGHFRFRIQLLNATV